MDSLTPIDGRFTPATPKDFSTRAARLAGLLEQPLHWGQEVLSRLYGFSNAHELRQSLKRDARVVGPYDEGIDDGGAKRRHALYACFYSRWLEGELAFRRALVSDLGLFASPGGHARAFAGVEDALGFYMPDGLDGPCYARVGFSLAGEAVLQRTRLGREVHDSLLPVLSEVDSTARLTGLKRIVDAHPENPWAQADLLDERLARIGDAHSLFLAVETQRLQRQADTVVALFRRLYGEHESKAIAFALVGPGPFGSDSDGYAQALVLSGKLALSVGDAAQAVRRFRRVQRMDRPQNGSSASIVRDPRRIGRFLDVALLNDGRVARRRRLKPSRRHLGHEGDVWRLFVDFAAAVLAGDHMVVRNDLVDVVLTHGRLVLKADLTAALRADADDILTPFSRLNTIESDRFFLATAPLWRARRDVTQFILAVLKDQAVARADGYLLRFQSRAIEDEALYEASIEGIARAIDRAWHRVTRDA